MLKKIGTLNERVAEVNLRKSLSPSRKTIEKSDASVQVINSSFEGLVSGKLDNIFWEKQINIVKSRYPQLGVREILEGLHKMPNVFIFALRVRE